MEIRELRAEDYDALCGLWRDAGLSFRPNGRDRRDRLVREIDGDCSIFLAAWEGDSLVGAVLGTHDGRKGWINRLAVRPSHQRRGIAAALVAEVEERFRVRGIEIVTCLIEDWNETSMAVFERLGYQRHDDILYYSKRRNADV
jgi:N-acetylglutamate synthase